MSLVSLRSVVITGCVSALGALALAGCTVTGTVPAPRAQINVQPATVGVQTTTYAQPVATGNVYAAPAYNAAVGSNVAFGTVSAGWVTNDYQENDYLAYHMTLRARQFAAGYIPITNMYRAQMGQGQRQYVTVSAQPGRCYRIIGVGGPGVQDLDLRLLDMNGNVLDQDVATDNFPVLGLQRQLCLNWSGSFRIEVIMYSGGGQFGLQAFATQ